jgi:hypothetical protein
MRRFIADTLCTLSNVETSHLSGNVSSEFWSTNCAGSEENIVPAQGASWNIGQLYRTASNNSAVKMWLVLLEMTAEQKNPLAL